MKSQFCYKFVEGIPLSLNNSKYFFGHTLGRNLNFSAEFWQPFIDVEVNGGLTNICGPLLGLVLEIANTLDYSLIYRKTYSEKHQEKFELFEKRQIDLFLFPFQPITAIMNRSDLISLSRCIDSMAMVNILSAKTRVQFTFHLLKAFDPIIWIIFAIFYVFVSTLSSSIEKRSTPFINYFGAIVSKTIPNLNLRKTASISMVWMYGSQFLMCALSCILLTFLVFPTPYDKIDSIEDLAKKEINFGVFEDETAYDYVSSPNEPYFHRFKGRWHKERAGNAHKKEWEQRVFDDISKGVYALVSDQPFNGYYFSTKLKEYENLYQSKFNDMTLPYFIVLSKFNSINGVIDKIICCLIESGIYEKWIINTSDLNNDAIKEGLVEFKPKLYEFSIIELNKLKGLFYLKSIAIILSLIAFIFELIPKSVSFYKQKSSAMIEELKSIRCTRHNQGTTVSLIELKTNESSIEL